MQAERHTQPACLDPALLTQLQPAAPPTALGGPPAPAALSSPGPSYAARGRPPGNTRPTRPAGPRPAPAAQVTTPHFHPEIAHGASPSTRKPGLWLQLLWPGGPPPQSANAAPARQREAILPARHPSRAPRCRASCPRPGLHLWLLESPPQSALAPNFSRRPCPPCRRWAPSP